MGIKNLNILLQNVKTCKIKSFNTIIIDGSNLIISFLSAIKSSMKSNNYNQQLEMCELNLIEQMFILINETVDSISKKLFSLFKFLEKNGEIIIVLDSPGHPKYITYDDLIYELKTEEQEKRREKTKINENIEKILIDLQEEFYSETNLNFECEDDILFKIDETIKERFISLDQLNYFDDPSNLFSLIPIILQYLMIKFKQIHFIRAISEADFVIKNLAYYYQNSLILSKDTDYLIFLSEFENVYVSDFKIEKIYHPYSLWREIFNFEITFDQLLALSLILGNDFTAHNSIITLTKKRDNIKMICGLFNFDNTFEREIRSSRLKIIKEYIKDFYPTEIISGEEWIKLISKDNKRYEIAYKIYKSWSFNFDFVKFSTENVLDMIKNKISKLQKSFEQIYLFQTSNFSENINNFIFNNQRVEEKDPYEYYLELEKYFKQKSDDFSEDFSED